MEKKQVVIVTRAETLAMAVLTETYGDKEPVAAINVASFEEGEALEAVYKTATDVVKNLAESETVEIFLPSSVYKTATKLVYAANQLEGAAWDNLTASQKKAFSAYKKLFNAFGSAVRAQKGRVFVRDITNLYRYQLAGTPDCELHDGDTFESVEVEVEGKNGTTRTVQTIAGMQVCGTNMLPHCQQRIEKRGESWYITRMINVDGEYLSTVDALRAFRKGDYVPEYDDKIRLMNSLALAAIANNALPKLAMFKGKVANA